MHGAVKFIGALIVIWFIFKAFYFPKIILFITFICKHKIQSLLSTVNDLQLCEPTNRHETQGFNPLISLQHGDKGRS